MTAPTAQFDEFATQAQEQVSAAVRAWADAVTSAVDGLVAERPALVDPKDLVEKYFDYAQLILDNQRQFAHSVLAAGAEAAQAVTEQTATAAKTVTSQAVSAVENGAVDPAVAETAVVEPVVAKPVVAKPVVAKPVVAKPAVAKPAVAAPRRPRAAATKR